MKVKKLIFLVSLTLLASFLLTCGKNPVAPPVFNNPHDFAINLWIDKKGTDPTGSAGSGFIGLRWEFHDIDMNELRHFEIWKGDSPNNCNNLVGDSGRNNYFEVHNLNTNLTYYFKVIARAHNDTVIAQSNIITSGEVLWNPPTNVGETQLTLNWHPPSNIDPNTLRYEIYKDGIILATVGANVTTYSVTNLSPNTTYRFEIVAFSSQDNKIISKSYENYITTAVNIHTCYYDNTNNYVNLRWQYYAGLDFSYYELFRQRSDDPNFYSVHKQYNIDNNGYIDSSITPTKNYEYKYYIQVYTNRNFSSKSDLKFVQVP